MAKKSAETGMVHDMTKTSRSLLLAVLTLALVPAGASAQGSNTSTVYPLNQGTDTSQRTIQNPNTSGYTGSTANDPLCLIPGLLICPAPATSRPATGGAGGPMDGYLRTSFSGVVAVTANIATSTATFRSANFLYGGDSGRIPDEVTFQLTRRANSSSVITVPGQDEEATYDVDLLRVGAPDSEAVTLINDEQLPGPTAFTEQPAIQIDPDDLIIGATYAFRITSTYSATAGVIPNFTADYDNIFLRAKSIVGTPGPAGPQGTPGSPGTPGPTGPRGPEGDQGPRGNSGQDGRDGSSGRNGLSPEDRRLRRLLRSVAPRTARIIGDNRSVKVKLECPKKLDDDCKMTVQGDLNADGRRLTKSRKVRINDGDSKTVTLPFVNNRRDDLGNRKRMNISQRVKAEDARAEITTRVRLKGN